MDILPFRCLVSFDGGTDRKGYTLRTDQLDEVYRRAAIISLLKVGTKYAAKINMLLGQSKS